METKYQKSPGKHFLNPEISRYYVASKFFKKYKKGKVYSSNFFEGTESLPIIIMYPCYNERRKTDLEVQVFFHIYPKRGVRGGASFFIYVERV